jgi:pimeloyl-ACP methyl ester carboxylesterase
MGLNKRAIPRMRWLAVLLFGATLLLTTAAASAQPARGAAATPKPQPAAGVVLPQISCTALGQHDFTAVPDAASRISSAADATLNSATYCAVKGYIAPQTSFELLLPESTWHGDYVQEGCGGYCGAVNVSAQPAVSTGCPQVAGNEFVLATDDQGHESPSGTDGIWAASDLALRIVFGYTSEHSLANLAKAAIRAYYGTGPAGSYFDGCSDGGHEALDLAQRYPDDFNGIIAGAPANNWAPLLGLFESWLAVTNTDSQGHQVLTLAKLPALHAAVMKACAGADGVIQDPRNCTFNPASIMCPSGTDKPTCLTPAQVTVVREEYRGPADPAGRNLYDGGEPYGSELAWTWFINPDTDNNPANTVAGQFGVNYLKYMASVPNPPASFTLSDLKFTDAEYNELEQFGGVYNATDPDLSAFRAHGGKLIIYHGWADQAIPPFSTIDYYAAVEKTMGGFASTQGFSRLYMVPGGYHCLGGGDPAVTANFLTPLINWVEKGQAPGALTFPVTAQTTGAKITSLTVPPLDAATPAPRNNGLNSNYHYIGINSAFTPEQTWCTQRGFTTVCRTRR